MKISNLLAKAKGVLGRGKAPMVKGSGLPKSALPGPAPRASIPKSMISTRAKDIARNDDLMNSLATRRKTSQGGIVATGYQATVPGKKFQ
jgi:hypothetical protein